MRVVLAVRQPAGRWGAFEAEDRAPESMTAHDCWVLVGDQAWRPADLTEHFHTSLEISEAAAGDLVRDYPWHKPHHHPKETT